MRCAFLLVAAAALGACGRPDVVAEEEDAAALPATNRSAPSPTGGPPANNATAVTSTTIPVATIPVSLHGRWGLTPRDCDSAIGEAEGILIINAEALRFYESQAVPVADVQTSTNSISGDFAFTGEGQQWTRHQTLDLDDGKLVRTERDPIASFRYVRC